MPVSDIKHYKQPPHARLLVPALVRMSDHAVIMSVILQLIASNAATTRPQLAEATGLARSTIAVCLAALEQRGLIESAGAMITNDTRGRPAEHMTISANAGVVLAIDLTPHHIGVALAQLDQTLVDFQRITFVPEDPEATLDAAIELARQTMGGAGIDESALRTVVVSFPGPVDVKLGVPVRPPIMPGWDGFPITSYLSAEFGCSCHVDNDVNLMALGEARVLPDDQCPLLVVKIGTGIGGGLVTAKGELHRGADGAACDIGHLTVPGAQDVICSCGNIGCIEAVASAEAITREFRAATGNPDLTQTDLRRAARTGDPVAIRLIRDAAAKIGGVVASLVHVYNPARIVVAGPLTEVTDDLLAGIRSVAYQRALPLATRNLTLAHSVIGEMAGIVGAVVLGIEYVLSPEALQ